MPKLYFILPRLSFSFWTPKPFHVSGLRFHRCDDLPDLIKKTPGGDTNDVRNITLPPVFPLISHAPPHDLQGVLSPFAFGSDGIRNAEKVHKNRVSYRRVGCTLKLHRFCWILKFTEFIYTPTKLTQNPRWLALLPDQDTEWDINATILCAYV